MFGAIFPGHIYVWFVLCYVVWFVRLAVVLLIVKGCLLLSCLDVIVVFDGLLLIVLFCEVFVMFGFVFVMVNTVC